MNLREVSRYHLEQLVNFLFYNMDQPLRGQLMRELPDAYNAAVGYPVVKVVRVKDYPEV